MAEHEPITPPDASSSEASGQVAPAPLEHAHENTQNPLVDGYPPQDQPQRGMLPFSVVGLGASAGGLDAYVELLQSLATDTGMAFVVVPHLSPDHESRMSEILSRYTTMPVETVVDGVRPEPDHVYVLPPGKQVFISSGLLRLADRPAAGHDQ